MKSLGERCLEVAMSQIGVKEDPLGSNSGPKVREYLAGCVRGDRNTKLNLKASNWCQAFASWCLYQALEDGETPAHGYRAGVVEAVADVQDDTAIWSGSWTPVKVVRAGECLPMPGDLAIYNRAQQGRPETAWWRHVNRVIEFRKSGVFDTIGGNESQMVKKSKTNVSKASLLGFINYPRPEKPEGQISEVLSAEEKAQLANLVYLTIDGMLRDSIVLHVEVEEDDEG